MIKVIFTSGGRFRWLIVGTFLARTGQFRRQSVVGFAGASTFQQEQILIPIVINWPEALLFIKY